jgi:hypothetical protein
LSFFKNSAWRRVASILVIEAVVLSALAVVVLDVVAHKRVEQLGGVNIWGYRGPVALQKQPNEIRIAIVGGTRAFGWGEPASALASHVRRIVMLTTDRRGEAVRPIVVLNLGTPGALPDAYPVTIERYAALQPDYICIYDDLGVRAATFEDRASGVAALTGYVPVLPLVLREKGMTWEYGDLRRAYAHERPSAPALRRIAGRAAVLAGVALDRADRGLARLVDHSPVGASTSGSYERDLLAAIDAAHRRARGVVVVLSPAETPEQIARSRAVRAPLANLAAASPWLRLVELGTHPELIDPSWRVDEWNYGSAGITLVAESIASPLVSLITAS